MKVVPSERLYAQFNEEGLCISVGTPNVSGVVATYENLGQKYFNGAWLEVPVEPIAHTPTNTEIAQLISDMHAEMLIAGVI